MREAEAMALLLASGLSYGRREAALCEAGSALGVIEEPEAYEKCMGEKGFAQLRGALRERNEHLDAVERSDMRLILRSDPGYPPLLQKIVHPPHLLYVWGRSDLSDACPMAMVGTRKASAYGLRHAREIACGLASAGVCVVSGLALGIDAASHEGALDGRGRTIAVLGGALDRLYPEENRPLMERILAEGGSVVSEYPPGTKAARYSFLQRNRIIAGMTLGTIVVEGPKHSGAFSTAQSALEEGREVFALPGSVEQIGSQLPHLLIAEGAHLITCARDILDELVIEPAKPLEASGEEAPMAEAAVLRVPEGLSGVRKTICERLLTGEADFDELCVLTGEDSDDLGALLIEMEMDELVEAQAGCAVAPGAAMRRP